MKFIFSFLFAFIFILPVSADNQCTGLTQDTNPTCTDTPGCIWMYNSCTQCQPGTYSTAGENECHSCANDPYYQAILSDQTKQHPRGASSCSDWECAENYVQSGDSCITDLNCNLGEGQYLPTGSISCDDWQCTTNYYLNSDQSACLSCPTGAISPAGSDDVNDCICPTDTHLAYNNGTYSCEQCSCTPPENGDCTATYNKTSKECQTTITCNVGYYKTETSGTISCTKCPSNSTTDGDGATSISECKCYSGYYRGGTNMNECIQCPDNSTNCISDSPSGLTAADVECDTNYQRFESDGVVTCEQCPEHSKYNTNTKSCECANGANGTFGINSTCACANNSDYNGNNNECECTTAPHLNPTYDNNGVLTCSSCADNAIYENGCKCKVGYYGDGDTNCEQCPNHSTTDDAGSTSISACKCNIGYYDTESDTDSVSCTKCPNNSTTDGAGSTSISACKCNVGYYDTESDTDSVSCTKCPIGMTTVTLDSNGNPTNTTTNGATSIEHCAMLATSDFCFTNPDSTNRQLICTPLILPGATKINGRTISTTTNSGN